MTHIESVAKESLTTTKRKTEAIQLFLAAISLILNEKWYRSDIIMDSIAFFFKNTQVKDALQPEFIKSLWNQIKINNSISHQRKVN